MSFVICLYSSSEPDAHYIDSEVAVWQKQRCCLLENEGGVKLGDDGLHSTSYLVLSRFQQHVEQRPTESRGARTLVYSVAPSTDLTSLLFRIG